MSRLGCHLAFSAQPRRHLFDKTGSGRYLGLFAFGDVEAGAGEFPGDCGADQTAAGDGGVEGFCGGHSGILA